MKKSVFFALSFVFVAALLAGCVGPAPMYYPAQAAQAAPVVTQPSVVYVQPAPMYYSPVYPSYWGPSIYFGGGGYYGGHRGGGHHGGHR